MQNLKWLYSSLSIEHAVIDKQKRARGVNRVRSIKHASGESVSTDIVLEQYRIMNCGYYSAILYEEKLMPEFCF